LATACFDADSAGNHIWAKNGYCCCLNVIIPLYYIAACLW